MRLALLLGVAALFAALIAALVWLFTLGDISVRSVDNRAGTTAETGQPHADPRLPELDPLRRPVAGGRLMTPVANVSPSQLIDTYTQARAGGARSHDAIDIMAPSGTPVVASAPGTVEKLFYSDHGGITAYIRSTDRRRIYYYAHLDRYAPGLIEGKELRAGDPIGLVGSTGNADPAGPHLHFAVMNMREGEGWWEGEAINPYPLLVGQ